MGGRLISASAGGAAEMVKLRLHSSGRGGWKEFPAEMRGGWGAEADPVSLSLQSLDLRN